jgi:hypothetical protein
MCCKIKPGKYCYLASVETDISSRDVPLGRLYEFYRSLQIIQRLFLNFLNIQYRTRNNKQKNYLKIGYSLLNIDYFNP